MHRAEQVFKNFDKWLDLVKNGEAEITNISVMRKPKPWVGLTDEEKIEIIEKYMTAPGLGVMFIDEVEAKFKEKNSA